MLINNVKFDPEKKESQEFELTEKFVNKKKKIKETPVFEETIPKEEIEALVYYEGKNFHPVKTPIFLITILLTIVYFLLKGSSSVPSIIGLSKCHWGQYVILAVTVIGIIIIQIYSIKIVLKEQHIKQTYKLHLKHEVLFTPGKIAFLIGFATIVGFLANLLGLGGGFVIFPMFVSIGVSPLVASATTIFMIFLSKIVAALLAVFSKYLKGDYTLVAVLFVVISVIIFSIISDAILKRYLLLGLRGSLSLLCL
jgi:uncharacterized membrane protein YfcA